MPSLQALQEFKSSFRSLGDELQILADLGQTEEDYPLPKNEPAPLSAPGEELSPDDASSPPSEDLTLSAPLSDILGEDTEENGFSFNDLLGGLTEDPPTDDELPAFDLPAEEPSAEDDNLAPADDELPPLDIDSLLADEDTPALADDELGSLDLDALLSDEDSPALADDELPAFDLPAEDPSAEDDSLALADDELPSLDIDSLLADEDTPADDDFSSLDLDALLADDESPSLGDNDISADFELPAEEPSAEDESPILADDDLPDFDLPAEDPSAEDSPADDDFSSLDLDALLSDDESPSLGDDDLPAFDLDTLLADEDSPALAGDELPGDFELPAEDSSVEDTSADDELPSFDLPAEDTSDEDLGADEDSPALDLDALLADDETPSLGDEDILADFELPTEDPSVEDISSDFDLPAEDLGADDLSDQFVDGLSEELAADFGSELDDAFAEANGAEEDLGEGNFGLDSDSLAENFDIDPEGLDEEFGQGEDFALPDIDSIFEGRSPDLSGGTRPRARPRPDDRSTRPAPDSVDEINLNDFELERFNQTLSAYPLNLRIACLEIIAEQTPTAEQMAQLMELLVGGAPADETASLAGKILGRTITIPRGYELQTGADLEAEQTSFAYIFVHKFLPVFRLFLMVAAVILSAGYLTWQFVYLPIRAHRIYQLGIERIEEGQYSRANERFWEAFSIHERKSWFYEYARAFRDARQYALAAEKYQELLYYTASKNRRGIPEKQAALEFAELQTYYIGDFEAADRILWRNILDFAPYDYEARLALGDNNMLWAEYDPDRYEYARESYAVLIEQYGRTDPLLERMLMFFIRTDNLEEVLALQAHFMSSPSRRISASSLAEMGGCLLDKQMEEVRGVPNAFLDSIRGVLEILLRAIRQDSMHPETYYHLARYYYFFNNAHDERLTLEIAVQVFDLAEEASPRRMGYHIHTLRRYAEVLTSSREFFPAEENLVKAIGIYQSGLARRLLSQGPEFGRLYADLGDLEYFVKDGDMQGALDYYLLSEEHGWAPMEVQYRMGAAHYQLRQWALAQDRLYTVLREMPTNRRALYAMANVSYMRGNYFAAQGYYDRLLELLNVDRSRLPPIQPTDDVLQLDLTERLMVSQNNLGVTLEMLTDRTGDLRHRTRAQALYSESALAWDIYTRNPITMIRMRPDTDIIGPGVNPAYLNVLNSLYPEPSYYHHFFLRIDRDVLEPSLWDDLAPPEFRLSEGIQTGR